VGVERIRTAEVLFQPSLVGCQQAGLSDTIDYVLKSYEPEIASALASDIFLTGGVSRIPGLKERLIKDVTSFRPFQSVIKVRISNSPSLNAWFGARDLASDYNSLKSYLVTKAEYSEKGGEYLKEHEASNIYLTSPLPLSLIDGIQTSSTNAQDDIEIDIV
jgi:actin-related protein 5